MGCWSLLVIDSAPIRKKAKEDYDKVLREIQKARQELERFETLDRPKYERWFHSQFGAILTELRQVAQQIAAQRDLLFEIESEAFFSGISSAEAYRRIQERKENPDAAAAGPKEMFEDEDDPDDEDADPFDFEFEEEEKRRDRKPPRAKTKPKEANKARNRVKDLYRMLARRLHPDVLTEADPQKLHWWHQTQAAYEAGDADQLELILTWCEISEQGAAAQTSVALLKRLTAKFRSSLRAFKQQIRRYRQEPAWDFSGRTDVSSLARRTQRVLQDELQHLQRVLRHFEQQIQGIAAAAARVSQSRRRRRRQPAPDQDEWFT